jgi:hypothetical protein
MFEKANREEASSSLIPVLEVGDMSYHLQRSRTSSDILENKRASRSL